MFTKTKYNAFPNAVRLPNTPLVLGGFGGDGGGGKPSMKFGTVLAPIRKTKLMKNKNTANPYIAEITVVI